MPLPCCLPPRRECGRCPLFVLCNNVSGTGATAPPGAAVAEPRNEEKASPEMGGLEFFPRALNETQVSFKVSKGFSTVTLRRGYEVGIRAGYYCAVRSRISSMAICALGLSRNPSAIVLATRKPETRKYSKNDSPERTPKPCNFAKELPLDARSK